MRWDLLLVFLLSIQVGFAQDSINNIAAEPICDYPSHSQWEPVCGLHTLLDSLKHQVELSFCSDSLTPMICNISSRLFYQFVIDTNGTASGVTLLKRGSTENTYFHACIEKALSTTLNTITWTYIGTGKKRRSYFKLPIHIHLK